MNKIEIKIGNRNLGKGTVFASLALFGSLELAGCGSETIGSTNQEITFANLIGDHIDRNLGDRKKRKFLDSDTAYQIGGSDTSTNANPFTNGVGGILDSAPSEVFLHKLDGSNSSLLTPYSVSTYIANQALWIKGNNKEGDGTVEFIAYSIKFDGPNSEEAGISKNTKGVEIKFLGKKWTIESMSPPNEAVVIEQEIKSGGSVTLKDEKGNLLQLIDGKNLLNNESLYVTLGWKNNGASFSKTDLDSLRSIVVFSSRIDNNLSTSGSEVLGSGDSININIPYSNEVWKLKFNGLEIVPSSKLTFAINNPIPSNEPFVISSLANKCLVYHPYLRLVTDRGKFQINGNEGSEIIIGLNQVATSQTSGKSNTEFGATCDTNKDGLFNTNDISYPASIAFFNGKNPILIKDINEITYSLAAGNQIGADQVENRGVISFQKGSDVTNQMNNMIPGSFGAMLSSAGYDCQFDNCSKINYYIAISEDAGNGYRNHSISGITYTTGNNAVFLNSTITDRNGRPIIMPENILYAHATNSPNFYDLTNGGNSGPVTSGIEPIGQNYISERGSVPNEISSSKLVFDIATKIRRALWIFSDKE